MALSALIKHAQDASVLTLVDGTGTPITLEIRYDGADLKVAGLNNELRDLVEYQNRGRLLSVRRGEVTFPTFSLTAWITDLSETGTGTLLDWVTKKTGTPFSGRLKTLAISEADTCHLKWKMEKTNAGDSADEWLWFKDCAWKLDLAEGSPNTFSISGKIYGNICDGEAGTNVLLTAPRAS